MASGPWLLHGSRQLCPALRAAFGFISNEAQSCGWEVTPARESEGGAGIKERQSMEPYHNGDPQHWGTLRRAPQLVADESLSLLRTSVSQSPLQFPPLPRDPGLQPLPVSLAKPTACQEVRSKTQLQQHW